MYRRLRPGQLSFENFYLPFGDKLSGDNRWVKLAEFIPWQRIESDDAKHFREDIGAPAKSFHIALAALLIKEKLGSCDEESVEQNRENPSLQYFLGFSEYQDKAPFHPSMLVHFRTRLSLELVAQVNEAVGQSTLAMADASPHHESSQTPATDDDEPPPPQGQLILDATCAPADIHYPTDLGLLNAARVHSEAIVDELYNPMRDPFKSKPRPYRKRARKAYVAVAK